MPLLQTLQTALTTFIWNCEFYRHRWLMCDQFKLLQFYKTELSPNDFYFYFLLPFVFHIIQYLRGSQPFEQVQRQEVTCNPRYLYWNFNTQTNFMNAPPLKEGGWEISIRTEYSAMSMFFCLVVFFYRPATVSIIFAPKTTGGSFKVTPVITWN